MTQVQYDRNKQRLHHPPTNPVPPTPPPSPSPQKIKNQNKNTEPNIYMYKHRLRREGEERNRVHLVCQIVAVFCTCTLVCSGSRFGTPYLPDRCRFLCIYFIMFRESFRYTLFARSLPFSVHVLYYVQGVVSVHLVCQIAAVFCACTLVCSGSRFGTPCLPDRCRFLYMYFSMFRESFRYTLSARSLPFSVHVLSLIHI